MSIGRCAFKVSYFSLGFARSRNSEKNPALQLQRSAMYRFTTYRSTGAGHHLFLLRSNIAPLEQRGDFSFMC